MLLLALALHLPMQGPPVDTIPDRDDSARVIADAAAVSADRIADAYLDPGARVLVARARERVAAADHSITEYSTRARERISVGIRALRRDRMLYRREVAADVLWRRDGVGHVRVLGAREVVPIARPDPRVPGRAAREGADLAFDPRRNQLISHLGDSDGDGIRTPLAPGSEADYRFATGDTTRIRLAGGREVRLVELRVIPRRPSGLLVRGSLWLDLDHYAAVRGVFRLAAPLDIVRDLEDEDDDDVPGILQPMEANLRYLTVDYGLWEDRWWMPRLVALEGEARVGDLGRVPVRFERSYESYQVRGEGMPPLQIADLDSSVSDSAVVMSSCGDDADEAESADDTEHASTVAPEDEASRRGEREVIPQPADSASRVEDDTARDDARARRSREECWSFTSTVPEDSILLGGPDLPGSIYDAESLISDAEIRELTSVLNIGALGGTPWHAPVTRVEYLKPRLVRYNRVQGLALGAEVSADFGAARFDATGWIGTSDLEPNLEVGAERSTFGSLQRLALYRRLETVQPASSDPGLARALSAFLFGRDDDDYHRTLGAELIARSAGDPASGYELRIFAERQRTAEKTTDLSVPNLLSAERGFHENITADEADQAGVELTGRLAGGQDPRAVRWTLSGSVLGETGDYTLARPGASASLGFPLPFDAVAAVEVAGGTSLGEPTIQRLWYLGGPATVRGYGGGSRISGEAFWRSRVEVGSSGPAARVALFSDAGWAGPRDAWVFDPPLLSAGIGASFLDGLLRVDLSRALRTDTGWRLDVHMDSVL